VTHNQSFSDIVEIDESGNAVWGSPVNWVSYSPFAPGRAEQIDKDTLLIAGIKTSGDVSVTARLNSILPLYPQTRKNLPPKKMFLNKYLTGKSARQALSKL